MIDDLGPGTFLQGYSGVYNILPISLNLAIFLLIEAVCGSLIVKDLIHIHNYIPITVNTIF